MHRTLGQLMYQIEQAISNDRYDVGARLLNDLIATVDEHFRCEEDIAQRAGFNRALGGSLVHDAFLDRARTLQARCEHGRSSAMVEDISSELVVLLSDIVESDLMIAQRLDAVASRA